MGVIEIVIDESSLFGELLFLEIEEGGFSLVEDNSVLYVISNRGEEISIFDIELILEENAKVLGEMERELRRRYRRKYQ